MSVFRLDPGECIVCGAPHCSCGGGPVEVVQLPARDAAARSDPGQPEAGLLVADQVQTTLPPGQFTSGTYRGAKKRR